MVFSCYDFVVGRSRGIFNSTISRVLRFKLELLIEEF